MLEQTSCENLVAALELRSIVPAAEGTPIADGYVGDLLSDVMAHAAEGCALITIQAHKNTVAVAELVGAACIIICNSREIPSDMAAACSSQGIGLYSSPRNQFAIAGQLYKLLHA